MCYNWKGMTPCMQVWVENRGRIELLFVCLPGVTTIAPGKQVCSVSLATPWSFHMVCCSTKRNVLLWPILFQRSKEIPTDAVWKQVLIDNLKWKILILNLKISSLGLGFPILLKTSDQSIGINSLMTQKLHSIFSNIYFKPSFLTRAVPSTTLGCFTELHKVLGSDMHPNLGLAILALEKICSWKS